MNIASILSGGFQESRGLSPWIWILIVILIIVLVLWWLGRTDRGTQSDEVNRGEAPVDPEMVAVLPAAESAGAMAAGLEMAQPEISMVERTVLDGPVTLEENVEGTEMAADSDVVQPETSMSTRAVVDFPLVTEENIEVSDAAVEEITGDTSEVKPVEYAPIESPPVVAVEVTSEGAVEDIVNPPLEQTMDELEMIEGIGPKIASVLRANGVNTFTELANMDVAELRRILQEAGLRLADPSSWGQQAQLAAEGKWDDFKTLTESLRGGRRVA